MNYLVLDLETANPNSASICQIGVALVEEGAIVGTRCEFIDPEEAFDPWNIRVHGIDSERVVGSPNFADAFARLAPILEGRIIVTHGSFDRVALTRACEKYRLPSVQARWLDNQTVVRRTWPQFAKKGYSLGNLANHFGIAFRHHDALEDAVATAHVFRRALTDSGRTATQWAGLIEARGHSAAKVLAFGDRSGPFAGKSVVFTGRLRVARREAARLAAERGFDVESAVTGATTLLCVGESRTGTSTKQREAERLASQGHPVAVVGEAEFWRMITA